jgi:hypothetical protein
MAVLRAQKKALERTTSHMLHIRTWHSLDIPLVLASRNCSIGSGTSSSGVHQRSLRRISLPIDTQNPAVRLCQSMWTQMADPTLNSRFVQLHRLAPSICSNMASVCRPMS